MTLNPFLKWLLRQALGKVRYGILMEFIEGPIGFLIDALSKGKITESVNAVNHSIEQVQEVAGRYGIRIVPK